MVVTKSPAELESAQLDLRRNNLVVDYRVNTINLLTEAFEKEGKPSFSKTEVLELLTSFAGSTDSEKKSEKKGGKKKKSPEEKREPTQYNLFIRNAIRQLREKFPEINRNILMAECAKIWAQIKEMENVDFATMDVSKYMPKNVSEFDDKSKDSKKAAEATTKAVAKKLAPTTGAAPAVGKKGKAVKA
jgi:hypothetical protein